jgi:hypothetical protein
MQSRPSFWRGVAPGQHAWLGAHATTIHTPQDEPPASHALGRDPGGALRPGLQGPPTGGHRHHAASHRPAAPKQPLSTAAAPAPSSSSRGSGPIGPAMQPVGRAGRNNARMHPNNAYFREEPNFSSLAEEHPALGQFITPGRGGPAGGLGGGWGGRPVGRGGGPEGRAGEAKQQGVDGGAGGGLTPHCFRFHPTH